MKNDEITEEMENAAIENAKNFGASKDIFVPDYGWILKDGEVTEAGWKFYEDHPALQKAVNEAK